MPFPKTLDHTPDLGKARIGPEMIERLCELIDELPEGQYQTRYCDTTELETRKNPHHDEQTLLLGALSLC
jgi:hypothetical protein